MCNLAGEMDFLRVNDLFFFAVVRDPLQTLQLFDFGKESLTPQ